jgi:hypothetical protein
MKIGANILLCVEEGIAKIISEIVLEKLLKENRLYFRIDVDATLLTIECFKLGVD